MYPVKTLHVNSWPKIDHLRDVLVRIQKDDLQTNLSDSVKETLFFCPKNNFFEECVWTEAINLDKKRRTDLAFISHVF